MTSSKWSCNPHPESTQLAAGDRPTDSRIAGAVSRQRKRKIERVHYSAQHHHGVTSEPDQTKHKSASALNVWPATRGQLSTVPVHSTSGRHREDQTAEGLAV